LGETAGSAGSGVDEELQTEKALRDRPRFSIRFRITSAFALAMLFSFGIGIASIVFISRMDSTQGFFERAESFSSELQHARRYEKNYFLYGAKSDLYDALSHVHTASEILESTSEIRAVLPHEAFVSMTSDLSKYEDLLDDLAAKTAGGGASTPGRGVEDQLRYFGHRILTYAEDMVKQERINMHESANNMRLGAIFALAVNLIVLIWVATELTRQILRPLGRFVRYTERISTGDFSPITPRRRFRDEFSNLAIAINRMLLELRRNQEQLLQSRKMSAVGTLTSGIAHELNNPLNNISITTEVLLENYDDYTSDQRMKMLRDIFAQTERASDTVRNLLDFTRVDNPRLESVDIAEVLEASLGLVANEMSLRRVTSEVGVDENLPRIRGYFRNLQQVFLNLFLNAVQAMSEGGKLGVRASVSEGKYVRVDVSDTGCGIPEADLDKIFDPFFTSKQVGQGTGLGLSVSYGIIQKIGGRLEVKSEVGHGSTFSVFLLVSDEKAK